MVENHRSIIGILLIGFTVLSIVIFVSAQPTLTKDTVNMKQSDIVSKYKIDNIVTEIERFHCIISDEELIELKLTEANIKKKHEFCNLSTKEKVAVLANEFSSFDRLGENSSIISGYSNSYSCYYSGLNAGIPTYQDLGLTSSSCSWTDPNPVCKVQGSVACMWGCTNKDPSLSWKTKYFSSKIALENEIKSKGYFQANTGYYSGISYTRQLPYGYRYEVQGASSGTGNFNSEGPEPDPGFNWYAFTNGWYPVEAGIWHLSC